MLGTVKSSVKLLNKPSAHRGVVHIIDHEENRTTPTAALNAPILCVLHSMSLLLSLNSAGAGEFLSCGEDKVRSEESRALVYHGNNSYTLLPFKIAVVLSNCCRTTSASYMQEFQRAPDAGYMRV